MFLIDYWWRDLFIRQKGKQEIKISLKTLGDNGFHPLSEPIVDLNSLGGGEFVDSFDHKGIPLRLGVLNPAYGSDAMKISEVTICSGTYPNSSGCSGTVEVNGSPYVTQSPNSFSLSDDKQILFNTINN